MGGPGICEFGGSGTCITGESPTHNETFEIVSFSKSFRSQNAELVKLMQSWYCISLHHTRRSGIRHRRHINATQVFFLVVIDQLPCTSFFDPQKGADLMQSLSPQGWLLWICLHRSCSLCFAVVCKSAHHRGRSHHSNEGLWSPFIMFGLQLKDWSCRFADTRANGKHVWRWPSELALPLLTQCHKL